MRESISVLYVFQICSAGVAVQRSIRLSRCQDMRVGVGGAGPGALVSLTRPRMHHRKSLCWHGNMQACEATDSILTAPRHYQKPNSAT